MKIQFPRGRINNTDEYASDEILEHRKELEQMVNMLYIDRSKIKLRKYRNTERRAFLRLSALCVKCKKEHRIRYFYSEEYDIIYDKCRRCREYSDVYEVLRNLITKGD